MAETKEDVVNTYLDLVAQITPILIECRVPKDHIVSWVNEPWHINNIRKARKYINEWLRPKIQHYISERGSKKEYELLLALHPQNTHIAYVAIKAQEVRDVWLKRPRFYSDRGRVEKEGYKC